LGNFYLKNLFVSILTCSTAGWSNGFIFIKRDRRIVSKSGGTGIAPFMAFARHLHATGDHRQLICLHGSSYVDELSYKDELTALDQESMDRGPDKWSFKYRAAISRPQEWFNRAWTGQTGRVEQF